MAWVLVFALQAIRVRVPPQAEYEYEGHYVAPFVAKRRELVDLFPNGTRMGCQSQENRSKTRRFRLNRNA
jgi:hypothetical protein